MAFTKHKSASKSALKQMVAVYLASILSAMCHAEVRPPRTNISFASCVR
jgi:hypothetical protein